MLYQSAKVPRLLIYRVYKHKRLCARSGCGDLRIVPEHDPCSGTMHSHQYRYDIKYDIMFSIIYAIYAILQPSEACAARPVHAKACSFSCNNI